MTFNGRFAQLTLFERGAIIALQCIVGWNRLESHRRGEPLWRFDICILDHWRGLIPFEIEEGCGCKGWMWMIFAYLAGKH